MTYIANALPLLGPLLGVEQATRIGGLSARQVAMQNHARLQTAAGQTVSGLHDPLALVALLLAEGGGDVSRQGRSLTVRRPPLLDLPTLDDAALAVWSAAFDGLVRMQDRRCALHTEREGQGLSLSLVTR
ncbi:MAG: hypothetical protein R3E68_13430 [Burkholderiaceae bacterium]